MAKKVTGWLLLGWVVDFSGHVGIVSIPCNSDWAFISIYRHPLITYCYIINALLDIHGAFWAEIWLIKKQNKIDSVIQLPSWRNGTIWDIYLDQKKVLSILCSLSVMILTFLGTKDVVCAFCGSYRGQGLDGADVQFGCGPEWRPFQWSDSL